MLNRCSQESLLGWNELQMCCKSMQLETLHWVFVTSVSKLSWGKARQGWTSPLKGSPGPSLDSWPFSISGFRRSWMFTQILVCILFYFFSYSWQEGRGSTSFLCPANLKLPVYTYIRGKSTAVWTDNITCSSHFRWDCFHITPSAFPWHFLCSLVEEHSFQWQ